MTKKKDCEGIDISSHQHPSSLDWAAIQKMGLSFCYIKALEGTTTIDPHFQTHRDNVLSWGLADGAYCYHHPSGTVRESAEAFVRIVGPASLPPVLDLETRCGAPYKKHSGCKAHKQASAQQVVDSCLEWMYVVQRELDRRPLLYAGPSFLAELVLDGADLSALRCYSLWVSDFNDEPLPMPGYDVVVRQWTDGGQEGPLCLTAGLQLDRNKSDLTLWELCAL